MLIISKIHIGVWGRVIEKIWKYEHFYVRKNIERFYVQNF